jgi:hypothetical protein
MQCISVSNAKHLHDYTLWLQFNNGDSGEVDLKDFINKFPAAAPLKNATEFANFYLDDWPTIAWKCGFDIDPEYLYEKATGKRAYTHHISSQD